MSLQASQVHAWQSAVNTVNLTTSGKSPAEKEVITSSDIEKVNIVLFVLFVASPCHACCIVVWCSSSLGTFVLSVCFPSTNLL